MRDKGGIERGCLRAGFRRHDKPFAKHDEDRLFHILGQDDAQSIARRATIMAAIDGLMLDDMRDDLVQRGTGQIAQQQTVLFELRHRPPSYRLEFAGQHGGEKVDRQVRLQSNCLNGADRGVSLRRPCRRANAAP